jgi:hypothetical protein
MAAPPAVVGWNRAGTPLNAMVYLYAQKNEQPLRLAATFDTQEQLLTYVRWATLQSTGSRAGKFEQGSVLASFHGWNDSATPISEGDATADVPHNPSPTML